MIQSEVFLKSSGFSEFIAESTIVAKDISSIQRQEQVKKAQKRAVMNAKQEVMNALTMLPPVIYCLFYLFTCAWLTPSDIEATKKSFINGNTQVNGCYPLGSSLFSKLYSWPPDTVLSICIGSLICSACSFNYHLMCAFVLPPGISRIYHWSRRLDQSMIHIMSIFWCYASSGNMEYVVISIAFNVDSIYRIFQRKFWPKRIVTRIAIAFIIHSLPIILHETMKFNFLYLMIHCICFWVFHNYPFGKWSHTMFHLFMTTVPAMIMKASMKDERNQEHIDHAAKCLLLYGRSFRVR